MLEITNLVTPSPEQLNVVIKGMRLPFKSGSNYDSIICDNQEQEKEECYKGCPYVDHWEGEDPIVYPVCKVNLDGDKELFVLGEKDKQLLLNLCSAGDPSHRKVLRQLPVLLEITAPEYFWRQLDQYKVGTVTNSTSQMHTLLKKPFELSDFSLEIFEYRDVVNGGVSEEYTDIDEVETWIDHLNYLRDEYLICQRQEAWYRILERIPQSFNYTRLWSGNYENLITILNQRKGHKLAEWEQFRSYVLDNVPYLKEIYESINGSRS